MHLFLRDRRPRWRSALLIAGAVVVVLAASRVDLAALRAFLAPADEAGPGEDTVLAKIEPAAADSPGIRARIALAWGYADLGRRSEGLDVLAHLRAAHPQDGEIAYAYASLLAQGSEAAELEGAFELYEAAALGAPQLAPLARLNQGLIRVRLGDASGGAAIWREQLAQQPAEPYRSLLENALARVESGDG